MLILELRVVDDAKAPFSAIAVVPLARASNVVTNPSGSAAVDKSAPLIVKAFAEPLPPAVEIPSASVPVTFVSPKLTASPATYSSLSKLVTISVLLAPVDTVSPAKLTSPNLIS